MAEKGISDHERQPATHLLRDVVLSRIEPSSICKHPKLLYPSIYDIMQIDMYVSSLCLYRLDSTDPSALSNFVKAVKNSLSQVLNLYYPVAGKWIVAEDAWTRKLVCNDEGVLFVEAAIDDEIDNVVDRDDYNPPEELTGLHAVPGFEAASMYQTSEAKEYPAFIVQVTRFKCGGIVVALTFNHMTFDGFAFNRFLKAWSEILSTGQTSVKPVFDRSMVVSHLDKSHILGIPPQMENRDDVLASYFKFTKSKEGVTYRSKIFSIRKDVLERLRQKTNEQHVSGILERPERFTTFECVCAQLWRCFARLPKSLQVRSDDEIVTMTFAVEGRRKWSNPPQSEDYVGNLSLLKGLPKLPGPEVTDKPISFTASHIHESAMKVNRNTSGELLDEMLKQCKERRSTVETLESEKPDNQKRIFVFNVTSFSRFDYFYSMDFGYGGPYSAAPCIRWTAPNTTMIVLSAPPPNLRSEFAIELLMHAPLDYFSILLEDPEFIHLVS